MSLLPSSPAVFERLNALRDERAIAKAAFRAAVEAASVGWEAELLLSLEEFRDAGGFAAVQDQLRGVIKHEMARNRQTRGFCGGTAHETGVMPSRPSMMVGGRDRTLCDLFLADVLDVNAAIAVQGKIVLPHTGDPTMETERAALRIRILSNIRKEMRDAIQAELDAQEAADRALVEERNRVAQEEADARLRLYRLGKR
jgi:hypothetical protein